MILEGELAYELNPNEFRIEWAQSNKTTIIVMDTVSCNDGRYGMNLIGEWKITHLWFYIYCYSSWLILLLTRI